MAAASSITNPLNPNSRMLSGLSADRNQMRLVPILDRGVFEVTQKQWALVMGTWPSYFTNVSYRDARPVDQVSYYQIRENPTNSHDPAVSWPSNSAVNAQSFMGRLRARTGKAFDLPTEAQWEYAGRAGTTTALNSGKNLTAEGSSPNMSGGTAKAGTYLPNAWGLYDIHGNVWEWCLDWYGTYPGTVSDPVGVLTGTARVLHGGDWNISASYSRVAYRDSRYSGDAYSIIGFRAALPTGQ
jgi:formylglycine-generating enzyme required for sulfatase activity